jgi:hypothetical protein
VEGVVKTPSYFHGTKADSKRFAKVITEFRRDMRMLFDPVIAKMSVSENPEALATAVDILGEIIHGRGVLSKFRNPHMTRPMWNSMTGVLDCVERIRQAPTGRAGAPERWDASISVIEEYDSALKNTRSMLTALP